MVLHWIRDLKSVLYDDIIRRHKQTPFIIAISFIMAFAAARLTVIYGPDWLRLYIRHYHIHHFYYGVILVSISNWIALTTDRRHMFNLAAVLFGVGLGLFIDEFGLLLTCTTPALEECDYFGRETYDAFMLIAAFFFAVLYSRPILSIASRIVYGFLRFFK